MGYTVQVQELFSVSFTTAIIKLGKEGKPIFFLNAREVIILMLIIHMKKLLDSDWLRAVQFKCNTSAKSVTPVQITHRNSGL